MGRGREPSRGAATDKKGAPPEIRVLARNRRASHEYHLEETFEAGVALLGSEVKSLRDHKAQLADAYVQIRDGEAWLMHLDIPQYPFSHNRNHEPRRDRKLLVHKSEIHKLQVRSHERGYTILPVEIYLRGRHIKVKIALARGKQLYDKREAEKKRVQKREIEAATSAKRR